MQKISLLSHYNKKNKQKQKINSQTAITALLLFFLFLLLSPSIIYAQTFNPNFILSDSELWDKDSISQAAIQAFLEREGSVLANYQEEVNGKTMPASEIIWKIGQDYHISPKFLLAILEKEKGLIHKNSATKEELDWAMGYSCYAGRCNSKYRGFYNQVESAAISQNIYREKAQQFAFQKGKTAQTQDGYSVTPENQATANLYIYTPFIGYAPEFGYTNIIHSTGKFGANYLFWKIWNTYFTERKIPNGFAIKNATDYWLIEEGKKRRFASKEIFLQDYQENDAIFVKKKILDAYPDGPEILFANNTLVRSQFSKQIYLLTNKTKRPILDESALALLSDVRIAINAHEIPIVEDVHLQTYPLGNPIDTTSLYPQGKLFQNENGEIFFVQDGMKFPVYPSVWKINFHHHPPEQISRESLDRFPTGSPIKIRDGVIVKNSAGEYFAISDGKKMQIKYPDILNRVFGEPMAQSAIVVSDEVLDIHPSSLSIAYADTSIQGFSEKKSTLPQEGYKAEFSSMLPEGIILLPDEKQPVTIKILNQGARWRYQEVWLEVEDREEKIYFDESMIEKGEQATFTFEIQAPKAIGLQKMHFTLYHKTGQGKEKILSFAKFILVKSSDTAEIISHNFPIAVKNSWHPVSITMKIKNTSPSTIWLSRKTALEIYTLNGEISPFYDPNDWVREEVAAVPINKSTIQPGEIGEFRFTLKVKDVPTGIHTIKILLKLLDQDKHILLNGSGSWVRQIRVDE